jgi:hypothetical protein
MLNLLRRVSRVRVLKWMDQRKLHVDEVGKAVKY